METYLLLFLVSLCPVVLSALIYLAERTNAARKIPYIARQVLIGIMFGALAIMGTEFGVKIDGASVEYDKLLARKEKVIKKLVGAITA